MVRPIESSWPKLKRGPVAKVRINMKILGTYTKAGTIPLAVIVREVEESLVHVGEATDGEAQPGMRSYPLRAVQSLAREVILKLVSENLPSVPRLHHWDPSRPLVLEQEPLRMARAVKTNASRLPLLCRQP